MNKILSVVRCDAPAVSKITVLAVLMAVLLSLTAGVAVAKTFNGTSGNDRLKGTDKADTMRGYAGNDQISGRRGSDFINAGPGNDLVFGDKGNDTIEGKTGRDELHGGAGNDTIFAGNDSATDYVFCNAGDDEAHIKANDLIDGDVSGQSLLDGLNTATSCETIFVNGIEVTNQLMTR
ncbi:MAG: hypothetical protein WKF28_05950 [Rubrobacteraceae bacterium]|jgi:Ca2+-binding RTX toxin-like protein|nr:hypothetical protein [Rubrobacter sp.]MBA3789928.1 hypothetical protein [Rubrobacter sp.]